MSLKTYIDGQTKDFLKQGTGDLLFGLENAPTYKLLPIYEAFESGSIVNPTEITAVKISKDSSYYKLIELDRIVLATDLIYFDSPTNQYLVDETKILTTYLENGIYYLEFKNGINIFETEAFLVQAMTMPITTDNTLKSADNTVYSTDNTIYTI